jgi:hypothetical protein
MTRSAQAKTFGGIVNLVCFAAFQIDDELELHRLLNRKIGRLGAFQVARPLERHLRHSSIALISAKACPHSCALKLVPPRHR